MPDFNENGDKCISTEDIFLYHNIKSLAMAKLYHALCFFFQFIADIWR